MYGTAVSESTRTAIPKSAGFMLGSIEYLDCRERVQDELNLRGADMSAPLDEEPLTDTAIADDGIPAANSASDSGVRPSES